MTVALWRRLAAEFTGTALLLAAIVGSGIAAQRLSAGHPGLQLLENTAATALALGVFILMFAPISGAHFNPIVSLVDWWLGRHTRTALSLPQVGLYALAQTTGAITGTMLANLIYALPPATWSTTQRSAPNLWLAELVATAGLILLIVTLTRTGRATAAPVAVAAYIAAAFWFTSSTSFANPAVTIGRAFTDTFAGIAPTSLAAFITAQLLGALVGVAAVAVFHPRPIHPPVAVPVPDVQPAAALTGRTHP